VVAETLSAIQIQAPPAMRIAVLSDIHGNLLALKAVLRDLAHRQVDTIGCSWLGITNGDSWTLRPSGVVLPIAMRTLS
jgi:hypothetical protein